MNPYALTLLLVATLAILGGYVAIIQRDTARQRADALAAWLKLTREQLALTEAYLALRTSRHLGVRMWRRRERRRRGALRWPEGMRPRAKCRVDAQRAVNERSTRHH